MSSTGGGRLTGRRIGRRVVILLAHSEQVWRDPLPRLQGLPGRGRIQSWPFLPHLSGPGWITRSLPQPEATDAVSPMISLETPRGVSWSSFALDSGHGRAGEEVRRGQVSGQTLRSTDVVCLRVNWFSTLEENAVMDSLDQREGLSPPGWVLVGSWPRRSEQSAASRQRATVLA